MRSQGTGESFVVRPLPKEKFFKECDPASEIDWFSSVFQVSKPALKQTYGSEKFHGSYNPKTETICYTKPLLGLVLHELAHHICHKQGLNRRHDYHGANFGRILQELIDQV